MAERLLGSKSSTPAKSDYTFIQYPELNIESPKYMTNNIISGTEFIDPFGTYYQVGRGTGLDPVVKNRIENVVDYSEYGRAIDVGVTERSILTADGTLWLGYTYLSETGGLYERGLEKMTVDNGKTDKFKTIVAGGAATEDNRFFRRHEDLIPVEYSDEEFWAMVEQGIFVQKFEFKLSLKKVTDNAARVFPYEIFTEQDCDDPVMVLITGCVVNEDG